MEFLIGIGGIIIIFVFLIKILTFQRRTKVKGEEMFNAILAENDFVVSKSINVLTYENGLEVNGVQLIRFIVDDKNKNFAIYSYNGMYDKVEFKNFKYSDLINFNLFEDGEQRIQGKGLMATGGALLFGITGAIVGTVAGDKKIKNKCLELSVRIQVNDLQNPLLSLVLLSNTDKNSHCYKLSKQLADELIATLTYIENNK